MIQSFSRKMIFSYSIFIVLISYTNGQSLTSSESVVEEPGRSVTLSCSVSGLSMNSHWMHWIRQKPGKGLEWIGFIDGGTSTYFAQSLQGQFSISKDTSKNMLMLQVKSLKVEDTAVYYCARGYYDGYFDYWGKGTQVTVSSESQTKPSVPFIVSQCGTPTDGLRTFGCITSGFFPESLEMEWTLGSGSKSSEVQFPAMKSQSNSFTAVSQVQISATDWTKNSLTCTVKHPAGSETVKGYSPPVIHVGEVGQSIMCLIEDFLPEKLSIKWKKDNQEVKGIDWKTTENPKGSFKAISLLQANKTSKETKYSCEVTNADVTYVQQLSSKAKFSLKINPPSVKELFVHNKAVITCVITGDNKNEVEAAKVSWTFGGQTRASTLTDNVKETTPPFTKTSNLTLSESEWFSGSEVKCSTERDKTPFSDKINVKKVGERPSVLFYKPEKHVSDSDKVSLLCEVSSSDLGDVYIMWKKSNDPYMEGSITVRINDNTVLSYLTVSGREYNNKNNTFACAVKDANTDNDTTPKIKSLSKLPPCPPCPAD